MCPCGSDQIFHIFNLLTTPSSGSAAQLVFKLDPLALSSRDFAFASLAGLFEMLVLLHLGHDACLLAGLLEAFHGPFERLIVSDYDTGHRVRSPLS